MNCLRAGRDGGGGDGIAVVERLVLRGKEQARSSSPLAIVCQYWINRAERAMRGREGPRYIVRSNGDKGRINHHF